MATADVMEIDTDTTTQEILLAATNHDIPTLRTLLRSPTGSANVQDPDTGFTPLHAAISACEPDEEASDPQETNGEGDAVHGAALDEDGAVQTVKFLFENGAIWNDLGFQDETPGCLALRLGLRKVYDVVVEAGVRAELLLARMDEFELLMGGDDEEDEDEGGEVEGFEVVQAEDGEELGQATLEPNGDGVKEDGDEVPQLVEVSADGVEETLDVNSADYLASALTFKDDRLLDADKNGVMMAWETDIMQKTADLLAPEEGLRVLNVGHGMGIVDGIFQSKNPGTHHIIEAHPAVIQRMKEEGWDKKPGVTVHEGRWQDIVPKLVEQNEVFDAIYFDTFAEDYAALKEFFSEYVIGLLDQEGRFGFFNGLGADRQVCYDVYTKVVEMDLFEAGLDTEFQEIAIPDLQEKGEWEGVRRKYWALDTYRMPTCKFVG
ncbi:Arginine N-methyltransferase 2 [Zalaria obscura]|uniref:Arginine N-methyltransferase 2 n=1 Tax=Zalaria obscura TaxID=2024903 RepID=A0ACC3SCQ9_9PEZI